MKKTIFAIFSCLVCFQMLSFAQSASEIAAARALARSYGYNEQEIDAVLNQDINGRTSGPVANRGKGNPQSQIPGQAFPGQYDEFNGEYLPMIVEPLDSLAPVCDIYGHAFFVSRGLSLIPSVTAPVPDSYVLGPGDNILINIWGETTANLDLTIAGNGSVAVPDLGPVFISGMKLSDAQLLLSSRMSAIYPGINDGSTSIQISTGKIRGVAVYVLGEVVTPGVYTLPSLSSISTAIYMAGGITDAGSVREINLFRKGKRVGTFDLYSFIFDGHFDTNLRLQDGDIVSVAPAQSIVAVSGDMSRNQRFEMKKDETLDKLVRYAGGFRASSRKDMVHVDRSASTVGTSVDVPAELFASFKMQDGDSVYVSTGSGRYDNRVTILGSVVHEGPYAISGKMHTVRQLIDAAGGLKEGSFMKRAYISRKDESFKPVNISFSLQGVMSGASSIELMRDDEVRIYSEEELRDTTAVVNIMGSINAPGNYPWCEGMTIGDLVLMAGGFMDGADRTQVELAVRGREDKAQVLSLDLSDLSTMNTTLSAYDKVFIRPMENYRDLKTIQVVGEVKYPGYYAVEKNTVRISDILERAGGFTSDAFTKGIRLKRKTEDSEAEHKAKVEDIARQNGFVRDTTEKDSLMVALRGGDYYYVAVNMQKIMEKPGTDVDIILREGDILEIPQMNNTVKISGGVMFPNVVAYNPSNSWKDYVNQAGGLVRGAKRRKIFAVYQDGSSAVRGSSNFRMEPGMELVVPQPDKSLNRQMSAGEIAAIASATTSIASMIVIIVNQLKK